MSEINWNELTQFEQQLRNGVSRTALDTHDVELASLLLRIGRRRKSRGETAAVQQPTKKAVEPRTLLEIERVGSSVAILRIAKPSGMRFQAGQHVKLGLPAGGKNPYTIASAPSDPHLEFCIERVPGGRLSTQLFTLEAGARLTLDTAPKGDFVLEPSAAMHLMVATVTGISPFRSMLREAAAKNTLPSARFVVLHGASFADELVYRSELEALAQRFPQHLRYIPSVSRPEDPRNQGFEGATGRLTALAPGLAQELSQGAKLQVYACGHPEMVQGIHETLGALGLPVASEVFD
ncbi:MAG TPA: FAD-binding oxidoreductase [Polyangiales bacterium]|nr:FAD-binding oxidoreductase [Polyangiales bacterium]